MQFASAWALVGLSVLGAGQDQELSRAVRIEYEVRERALFPERFGWERSDFESWSEAYASLDALARRTPGDLLAAGRALAEACLRDPQPNLRAMGLRVLARHRLPLPEAESSELFETLLHDRSPGVQQEFARVLAGMPGQRVDQALLQLEANEVEAVAREARAQLLARGPESLEAQLELFRVEPERLTSSEFLEALRVLDRVEVDSALIDGVDDLMRESCPPGGHDSSVGSSVQLPPSHSRIDSRRAMWTALRASKGLGVLGRLLSRGWAVPLDVLSRGWAVPLDVLPLNEEGGRLDRRRRRWLSSAIERGDVSAHVALLQELKRLAGRRFDPSRGPSTDGLNGADDRAWILEGAMRAYYAHPPGAPDRGAYPFTGLLSETIVFDPGFHFEPWWIQYFEFATGLEDDWKVRLGPRVYGGSPELRSAAFDAFADTFRRTGNAASRDLVMRALEYPDLARDAYRCLVGGVRPAVDEYSVVNWWKSQPVDEQLDLLRDHERGVRFELWREALTSFWLRTDTKRVAVLEVLAGFEGDPEIEQYLEHWIHHELKALEAQPVPDEDVKRGAWRESEARALWLLKTWLKVRGREADLGAVTDQLRRVGQLGKELGKALIAWLVKSPEGRVATRALLDDPALSRRLRFEILLTNEDIDAPEELHELFIAYDSCDADLRLRILRRAEGLADDLIQARLLEVARSADANLAEALAAIEMLATTGESNELAAELWAIAEGHDSHECKPAILRAIGSLATSLESLPIDELDVDPSRRALFADEVLPALVRVDLREDSRLHEEIEERWRNRPDDLAISELQKRFRGAELADRDFEYSGWLRAAQALHEAGVLEEAMGQGWWRWDGRLLARLSETLGAPTTRDQAEFLGRLDLAALMALAGEGEAPERPALMLRLRTRLLQNSLSRRDWAEVEAWSVLLLDDLRAGRTSPTTFESVLGSFDRKSGRDPEGWLLTLELVARAQLALGVRELELAQDLHRRARALSWNSKAAKSVVRALELDLQAAGE